MGSRIDNLGDKRQPAWKPGESGNPKGRPKDKVRLVTLVKRELLRLAKDAGEDVETGDEALALAMARLISKGSAQVALEAWTRLEGRADRDGDERASVRDAIRAQLLDVLNVRDDRLDDPGPVGQLGDGGVDGPDGGGEGGAG